MTAETILIAAFSARALAASARRAGFLPLVVDCFGDTDTCAYAAAWRCLPARVQVGFSTKPLLAALDELAREAPRPPIGLVLGSGFECNPRLVARLAEHYRLLGNPAETIRRSKDPSTFFPLLDRLGIAHPETHSAPPPQSAGWLMKRIGGSGGLHIVDCPPAPRPDRRRYFQRKVPGTPISMAGIAAPHLSGFAAPPLSGFAATRQWTSPLPRRPYRYGGAAGPLALEGKLAASLAETCGRLAQALDLVGLVSFDFLIEDGRPLLLEVNPRPGATLDVLDDVQGSLFRAHVEAARDGSVGLPPGASASAPARAAAILYADRGPLTLSAADWPLWTADRPRPGASVGSHQPLATVTAEGPDPDAAETLCHSRLGLVADMLYEGAK